MATQTNDAEFLLACIVHGVGQVDMKKVAAELGYTNPMSASNRLAKLKKTHAVKTGAGSENKVTKPTPSPTKKGSRKQTKKKNKKKDSDEDSEKADEIEEEE